MEVRDQVLGKLYFHTKPNRREEEIFKLKTNDKEDTQYTYILPWKPKQEIQHSFNIEFLSCCPIHSE
jgi:hypothetical protein